MCGHWEKGQCTHEENYHNFIWGHPNYSADQGVLFECLSRALWMGSMNTFSPSKTPEWAGALPGVVGEGEGLQAIKGEARGQLAQAVVIQVNMLQCAHACEGAI